MASTKTVTLRALTRRINRALATEPEGLTLRACDSRSRWHGELGDFYAVTPANVVHSKNVDPARWGRKMGVLARGEKVIG